MDSVITSGSQSSPTATSNAVSYNFVQSASSNWAATEAQRQNVVPIAGTVKKLGVLIANDPGSGASWTFTIRKNGVDTGLTVTISSGSYSIASNGYYAEDLVNSFTVAAGDVISLKAVASATAPATTGNVQWGVIVTGTTDGESLVMGSAQGTLAANTTAWLALQNDTTLDTTAAANRTSVMPNAGVIDKLYVDLDGALGSGQTYTVTLYKNGIATALTCVVTGTGSTGSDTTHQVSYNAGDLLYWEVVSGATITTARRIHVGARLLPTVNGESVSLMFGANTQGQNTTRYNQPSGGSAAWGTVEANRQSLARPATVKKLYVATAANVGGAGQSFTVTLRIDSGDFPNSMTCAIASGSSAANDVTNTNSVGGQSSLSIKGVTTATTGTVQPYVSFVFYIAPSAGRLIGPSPLLESSLLGGRLVRS